MKFSSDEEFVLANLTVGDGISIRVCKSNAGYIVKENSVEDDVYKDLETALFEFYNRVEVLSKENLKKLLRDMYFGV